MFANSFFLYVVIMSLCLGIGIVLCGRGKKLLGSILLAISNFLFTPLIFRSIKIAGLPYIIGGVIIAFGAFSQFIDYKKQKKENEKLAQVEAKVIDEKKEQEEIIRFASRHGVDLKPHFDAIEKYFDQGITASLGVWRKPTSPTYTQGLIKGSIGDNISTISNAVKKEEYEQDLAKYHDRLELVASSFEKMVMEEKLIVKMLREIPEGSKYALMQQKHNNSKMQHVNSSLERFGPDGIHRGVEILLKLTNDE